MIDKSKEEKLPPAICKKEIKVGLKIPNEVIIWYDGGSIAMNLGSWYFDSLFNKQLSFLQDEKYVFSEICRNENEMIAFYESIKENTLEHGYDVVFKD